MNARSESANDDRIEVIRARRDAITPPPWILVPELCGPEGQGVYELATMGLICEVGDPYPRSSNRPQENMEFIAHAPDDIAFLLAEIEALRQQTQEEALLYLTRDGECIELAEKVAEHEATIGRLRAFIDLVRRQSPIEYSDELEALGEG